MPYRYSTSCYAWSRNYIILLLLYSFHGTGTYILELFFYRPLATFFSMPSGYTSCDDISSEEKDELSVVGSELMKGTGDGNQANICILNQEGVWATEPVTFTECGGFGCCRFEFVNQPPQEE